MIEKALFDLMQYIDKQNLCGYDPYDALNSRLLNILSFNVRELKIVYTQGLKRMPWNIRKIIGIKAGINPKGMGILASAYLRLFLIKKEDSFLDKVIYCLNWLKDNYSNGYSGYCWGYNFDWQSRGFFLSQGTPTIVNTAYISNAFLDAYDFYNDREFLDIARSSCNFIIKDLNKTNDDNESICFSYTPTDQAQVYNASLLGACLLARVYSYTGEHELLDIANSAINFVITHQNADGSWYYGNTSFQKWIDGYHTGFILESLYDFIKFSGRSDLSNPLNHGLEFYKKNLFTEEKIPKFRSDKLYPIDIHCCASAIITFSKLRDIQSENLHLANEIAKLTIQNMQDDKGYFYFQKYRLFINKIPYMRWSQVWMLNALSILLLSEPRHE